MARSLDYETTPSYTLTVQAADGGSLSDTTTVSITVTDVNEAPSFGSTTYTYTLAEDAAIGTAVGIVSATDPDEGDTLSLLNQRGQRRRQVCHKFVQRGNHHCGVTGL